jgi:hypothetical protein
MTRWEWGFRQTDSNMSTANTTSTRSDQEGFFRPVTRQVHCSPSAMREQALALHALKLRHTSLCNSPHAVCAPTT